MKTMAIRINGANIRRLIDLVPDEWKKVTLQPGPEVFIFFGEKYYARNNSQLMQGVVIKIEGEEECRVTVLAGGAGAGLFNISYGSEDDAIVGIARWFKKLCEVRNWIYTDEDHPVSDNAG